MTVDLLLGCLNFIRLEMEIINIFSSPILKTQIDIKHHWMGYIRQLEYERNSHDNAYVSSKLDVLQDTGMRMVKKKIEEIINMYMENYLRLSDTLRITSSWVMKHKQGDYAQSHQHKNSVVSGVLYLQTKEGAGNIIFNRSNFLNSSFEFNRIEHTPLNTDNMVFSVDTGTLLLFPSSLHHRTDVQPFKGYERICLAFNTFFNDSIGTGDTRVEL